MIQKKLSLIGGMILFLCSFQQVQAQYQFEQAPLLEIIHTLEQKEGYRFLYRESQVANISLSFKASPSNFIEQLEHKLLSHNIAVNADTSHKQIVLYRQKGTAKRQVTISGQVVDAKTGERLPFATVYWNEGSIKKGVASNSSGVFHFEDSFTSGSLTLHYSYIGYQPGQILLELSEYAVMSDLTLRLTPSAVQGNDIIITGFNHPAGSDSIYRSFVNAGVLNPLGENNIVKALQALPSVSNGAALNNGVNVRGSSADATHILLDGITIYNQSHLFGLLDSFNPSVLQTAGFYYDVAPAQFSSTPGGTISLLTKTGSLNDYEASVGLSNTAFNASLHGPLIPGIGSWLFSGRTSYMNALNWFQNEKLIAYGLNIDRPNDLSEKDEVSLESKLVFPGDYDAHFIDLHGKMYFEFKNGSRLIAGAYYGADNVSQQSERLVRGYKPGDPGQRFVRQSAETSNQWGNFSSSLTFKTPLTNRLYSSTLAAASIYYAEFSKDDFVYNRIQQSGAQVEVFAYPLQNRNVFNEFKVDQTFDLSLPNIDWIFGGSYQYFMGEYFEESFDRPGFLTTYQSSLADVFTQFDVNLFEVMDVHLGSRLHYYTNGWYLYNSPRVKLQFFADAPISFSVGYSRDYQFAHRLSFYNVSSPNIWTISTKEQPPTSSHYYTTGMYFRITNHTLFQVEGYYKTLQYARLFDISTQTLTSSFDAPPWHFKNDGEAKGLEFLLKNNFNKFSLINSYTLSEATFQNPDLLNGVEFYGVWDRTHSVNFTLEVRIIPALTAFLSHTFTSGAPNRLYFLQIENTKRLQAHQRIDAGLEYKLSWNGTRVEINTSVYNLLNRNNSWYRELNLAIDTSVPPRQRRLSSQPVNVYDLGIQPSFNIQVWF